MARKGLGKGLDSLIPEIYDENFDSNATQSLEDILNGADDSTEEEITSPIEEEVSSPTKEEEVPSSTEEEEEPEKKEKNIFEEIEEENEREISSPSEENKEEQSEENDKESIQNSETSEEIRSDIRPEEDVRHIQKIQVDPSHIDEVTKIVDKNPRITLWSSRSAAVLRYLRKTEPEFSISKEASTLIDEAVSKKYPEIWELFDQY